MAMKNDYLIFGVLGAGIFSYFYWFKPTTVKFKTENKKYLGNKNSKYEINLSLGTKNRPVNLFSDYKEIANEIMENYNDIGFSYINLMGEGSQVWVDHGNNGFFGFKNTAYNKEDLKDFIYKIVDNLYNQGLITKNF